MEVSSRHHTKLIGRRGAVINKVRTDHDVQIIFPERSSDRPDVITIVGLEEKTKNARDEILGKVRELVRIDTLLLSCESQVISGYNKLLDCHKRMHCRARLYLVPAVVDQGA